MEIESKNDPISCLTEGYKLLDPDFKNVTHESKTSDLHTAPSERAIEPHELQPPFAESKDSRTMSILGSNQFSRSQVDTLRTPYLLGSFEEGNKKLHSWLEFLTRHESKPSTSALLTTYSPYRCLVPVRIDLELDGLRYIDSFTWDANDHSLSLENFAAQTISDLALPNQLEPAFVRSVRKQIMAWQATVPTWENELYSKSDGECLVLIELSMRFNAVVYRDRFEWDLDEPLNSPELFAARTVSDLMLPQQMEPAIAHSIHEQLANHRQLLQRENACGTIKENRSALDVKGEDIDSDSLKTKYLTQPRMMPPVYSETCILPPEMQECFTPHLNLLSPRDQMELRSRTWQQFKPAPGSAIMPNRPKSQHIGLKPQFTVPLVDPLFKNSGVARGVPLQEGKGGEGETIGGAQGTEGALPPRQPPDVAHLRGLPLQQQVSMMQRLMVMPIQRVIPGKGAHPHTLVLEREDLPKRRGRRSHADAIRKQEEEDQVAALQVLGYAVQIVAKPG